MIQASPHRRHQHRASNDSRRDQVLGRRVARALRATGYFALCDLKVRVKRACAFVYGSVPTAFHRAVAREAVASVKGLLDATIALRIR